MNEIKKRKLNETEKFQFKNLSPEMILKNT